MSRKRKEIEIIPYLEEIEIMTYLEDKDNVNRERYRASLKDKLNEEVGYFEIDIKSPRELSIEIDEKYQGKGYTKKLINKLCKYLHTNEKLSLDDKLYIDTDASTGFWEKIGMIDTPKNDKEGEGYEKVITFDKLCEFGFSNKKSKLNGGKNKKTRRRLTKKRTSNKKRHTKKRR